MTVTDRGGSPAMEVAAYRGRGTSGWRVESSKPETHEELIAIDQGQPFGGEWPERQEWQVISGQGELRWSEPFRRVRVTQGERYRFEPGERRLIVAETTMRMLITTLE